MVYRCLFQKIKPDVTTLIKNDVIKSLLNNPTSMDSSSKLAYLARMESVNAQFAEADALKSQANAQESQAKAQESQAKAGFAQAAAVILIGVIVWKLQSDHESELWNDKKAFKLLEKSDLMKNTLGIVNL